MELFIIRHAQSENNALTDQSLRVVDPKLTQVGLHQAAILAAHLANGTDGTGEVPADEPSKNDNGIRSRIDRLFCSAMYRALETAELIGRALRLSPEVWVDIHEHGGMWLDHGAPEGIRGYPGMTRAEIHRRFPGVVLPAEVTSDGWWSQGREDMEASMARAARVAAELRAWPDPRQHVALVTHGDFGAYLLRAILGVAADAPVFFHHDNTGVTHLRVRDDGRISMRYQNRLSHLPPKLVT